MALALAVAAAGLYRLASRLAPPAWAAGATAVAVLVPGPFYKFYVRGAQLLLLLPLCAYLARPRRASLAWAGAATGLAFYVRLDAGHIGLLLLAGAAGLGWQLHGRDPRDALRDAGAGLLAALLVTLPMLVHLGVLGILGQTL